MKIDAIKKNRMLLQVPVWAGVFLLLLDQLFKAMNPIPNLLSWVFLWVIFTGFGLVLVGLTLDAQKISQE